MTPSSDGAGAADDDKCDKPKNQFASQQKSVLGPSDSRGRRTTDQRLAAPHTYESYKYVGLNYLEANNVQFSDAGTDATKSYSFKNCSLIGAQFHNSDLRFVDFEGADLTGASFLGADLSGASFKDAIIFGTDFTNANMYETDFEGAFLE